MAIAIAIKLLIFLLLITISSVIGIQVFENVSENSTKIIPTTTNHDNNNDNNNNNNSSRDSNNSNDLNNRSNNSESGSINEHATGTVSSSSSSRYNHKNYQRNHHREQSTQNSFLANIHNTMPIQYPKTTTAEDHNNGERDNDPVEYGENVDSKYHQASHNKKRQLFGKTTTKPGDRSNGSKIDATNHNLTPSNSHHSTLNFVPSPQFDVFNEQEQPSSYTSPNLNHRVQFKPTTYDSYQNIPISHTESPRFADFPKYPGVVDLNKDYPKFDELSKHYQQTQNQEARHNGRNFFYNQHHYHHTVTTQSPPPPAMTEIPIEYQTIHQTNSFSDDGKFIWVPNTATVPLNPTTVPSSAISHETRNVTGKWKWISDDSNSGDVEPKIMTPISAHPSYYEQIKIYHDIKTHPILQQDFPYSFDFKGSSNSGWDSNGGGNGKGTENSIGDNITTLLSQWESMDVGGKEEKEQQNKTEPETPVFGKGNFGLADLLFPLMHKGKPAETSNKHIGNSSWKKVLHFLTAAIPIGLIISSLAPQVIYINANDTGLPPRPSFLPSVFKPAFQRSLDDAGDGGGLRDESRKMTNPLMDFLQILGENTRHGSVEQNTICEDRVFCEIAVLGAGKNADVLNKMLWKIANETPEPQARRSGLSEIFRVIRENQCHIYECERIRNSIKMSN